MRISLKNAVHFLQNGKVIAVPTETVYGLAACVNQPQAIQNIFSLKNRPAANPLIIHLSKSQSIESYVTTFPPHFEALAQTFWPGPMTCILPIRISSIPSSARAGLQTAGFRIPASPLARILIDETGSLVMPSANISGRPSATKPEHIEEDFGMNFPILDDGPCLRGIESTILFYQETEWVIVRLGALSAECFKTVLGYKPRLVVQEENSSPLCPGQLFRHYAPLTPLLLDQSVNFGDISHILGFSERTYPADKQLLVLGSLSNSEEVAQNLYRHLRQLDAEQAKKAWVDMDFPREGLWLTIEERLQRASCELLS